jgi:hypothetical protein
MGLSSYFQSRRATVTLSSGAVALGSCISLRGEIRNGRPVSKRVRAALLKREELREWRHLLPYLIRREE